MDATDNGVYLKPIPGFPGYFVSPEEGAVYSRKWGRLYRLTATPCSGGRYLKVGLKRDGERTYFMVHRLVALVAFGPRPVGKQINHKNSNRTDNRSANLEYVTQSENMKHARSSRITRG